MANDDQSARPRTPGDEVAANLDERVERAKQQERELREKQREERGLDGTSRAEQTPQDQVGGDVNH